MKKEKEKEKPKFIKNTFQKGHSRFIEGYDRIGEDITILEEIEEEDDNYFELEEED